MANPSADTDIRTRIDSFLAELSGLVRKVALESVHDALAGGSAPRRRRRAGRPKGSGRRGPGRPRKSARRARPARAGKRIRRSAADLEKIAARVLAHVKSNAGQRLEQIGKALKVETAILKRPVANLLAGRKLRTKGQKRGTMYFAGAGGGAKRVAVHRPAKRSKRAKVSRRRAAKRARKVAKKRAAKVRRRAARASDATAMLAQAERMAAV